MSLNCWIDYEGSGLRHGVSASQSTGDALNGIFTLGEHVSETSEFLSSLSAGCSEEDEP